MAEQDPSADALRNAFRDAKQRDIQKSRDALKESVCAFADDKRRLGWPPERVLVALKEHARAAGFRITPPSVPLIGQRTDMDMLLKDVVRWCIERYYSQSKSSDAES